ncbi:MAG TPA: hypothetical protein VGE07_08255 [Herpetosiphonaceae bacterium]
MIMIRLLHAGLSSRIGRVVLGVVVALVVGRVLWVDGSNLVAGVVGGTMGLATVGLAVACLLPCLLPLALLRRKKTPATPALATSGGDTPCGCGSADCGALADTSAPSR